jgi:hypothetical protein
MPGCEGHEFLLITDNESESVPKEKVRCHICDGQEGDMFKCKTCVFVLFCRECRDKGDGANEKEPQCEGHDFLQIPGKEWKNLPKGKVNQEGQSFGEWLVVLQDRYLTMK